MKKALFVFLIFLLTLLQITITWHFKLGWHNYQLMLTAIIILSMFDVKPAYFSAVLCGFMLDCMQSQITGLYILMNLLAVIIVKFLSVFMYKRSIVTAITLTACITFVFEFFQFWMFILLKGEGNVSFALTKLIFPQVFINMGCAVVLYGLFKFMWKKMHVERERW